MVIRVALCAHVRLYRDGLAHALSRLEGLELVASVGDASGTALATLREAGPTIVLVDATDADGPHRLRLVVEGVPAATIVALAIPEVDEAVIACAEAGVAAYTTRDSTLDELVTTLYRAARGEVVFAPHIGGALMKRVHVLASNRANEQARARLTRREREVIELIDAGLSNKQIAQRLSIELATVKNHVHNILGKLDVGRRSEAAATVRTAPVDRIEI